MRFLVTPELGRLARWLRLLGYDTAYAAREKSWREILIQAMQEQRILVARDRRYRGGRGVPVVRIVSDRLKDQMKQFLGELKASPQEEAIFTRCLRCNEPLETVRRESVSLRVPPYVLQTAKGFVRCARCDRIYWPGTHLELAHLFLREVSG